MNDTAQPTFTQWGTPAEWWNTGLYPKPGVSLSRWAWEFLRRNPDFRRFWTENILPYYDAATGAVNEDPYLESRYRDRATWMASNPPRGSHFDIVPPTSQMEERFGAGGNPCRGDRVPGFGIPGIKYYHSMAPSFVAALNQDKTRWRGHQLNLKSDEIAIVINTSWPIKAQLERIEHDLRFTGIGAASKETRLRVGLYSSYLQILDAADADVDMGGIAMALFPEEDNVYPDYKVSQRVRDRLEAACELRYCGYRYLAALDSKPLASLFKGHKTKK